MKRTTFELQRFNLYGTNGNDTLSNAVSSNAIYVYSRNDSIYNSASYVTINAGDGNDTVRNLDGVSYVTVDGGAGNDIIVGRAWDSSLNGGDGADVISIGGGDVDRATIRGGYGNDTIYFDTYDGRNLYQYASGDGYDVLYYLNADDTIHVTSGSVSSAYTSGSDVILNVGSGSMTLKNKANQNFYLKTGAGSAIQTMISGGGRYISNTASNTVLTGTSYNDTVYNTGSYVAINAGAGNDTIYSSNGSYRDAYVTINAGDGNDTIVGLYGDSSISGGAGDDKISMSGDVDRATINGGTGNDTIYLDGWLGYDGRNMIQYSSGDGYDTVYGFQSSDSISISGSYTASQVGGDYIYYVGSGSIRLVNYTPPTVPVYINNTVASANLTGATSGNDTINNSGTNSTIYGYGGNDSIYNNSADSVKVYAGDGADTVYNNNGDYSYIDLGDGADSIYSYDNDYVTIYAGAGNDTIGGGGSYYSSKIYGGAGNDLFNGNFRWDGSILDGGDGDDTINNVYGGSVNGGAGNDRIVLSAGSSYVRTIRGGYGNDTIYGDSLSSGYGVLYQYASGDGYDTIFGFKSTDTLSISGSYTASQVGSDYIYYVGSGSVRLVNYRKIIPSVFTEYADTYSNSTANTILSALGGNDSVSNSANYVTMDGGAGNDSLVNRGNYVSVNGGLGADTVLSYGNYVTISTGDGNDSVGINTAGRNTKIYTGVGNDSINNWGSLTSADLGNGDDYMHNSTVSGYSTIFGGEGSDSIYNRSDDVSISGGNGADSIVSGYYYDASTFFGKRATISGGAGNDTIINNSGGDSVKIYGDADNDSINNYGSRNTIQGGAGNDRINILGGSGNTVIGGTGSDTVSLSSSSSSNVVGYSYGDGYDTVYGYKSGDLISIAGSSYYTTLMSGSNKIVSLISGGAMTFVNPSSTALNITGGTYTVIPSVLTNSTNRTTFSGTSNADIMSNTGTTVTVYGYAGNDSIYNGANSVTVDGGAGNDTIVGRTWRSSLNGGDGADVISIGGGDVDGTTILGGYGNDTIYGDGYDGYNIYVYAAGDGYDTVYGAMANDTLIVNSGSHSTTRSGDDFIVYVENAGAVTFKNTTSVNVIGTADNGQTISNSNSNTVISTGSGNDSVYNNTGSNITISTGAGNDTIYDSFAEHISIDGGDGADSIYGNNNYATIQGGFGNDTIYGNHWRSKLNGGAGADVISLTSYWYNTIDGGEDNDTIIAGGGEASVNGGAGNDKITLSGSSLTIRGGAGNDIVSLSGSNNLVQYNSGDGSDVIYGHNSSDSLTITGATYTVSTVGNNVNINISDGNTITLVGAKNNTIWINGQIASNGSDFVTPQDVIMKFMGALDTTASSGSSSKSAGEVALDNAVYVGSGGKYSTANQVINALISDAKSYVNSDPNNGGKRFLLEKCGINFENEDTGAITGYDAGATSTFKTAENVIYETGTMTSYSYSPFQVKDGSKDYGLTVSFGASNPSQDMIHLWNCIQNWWAKESLQLIEDSYGYSFLDTDATVRNLSIQFTDAGNYKAATGYTPDGRSLRITISLYHYNNFASNDYNGISPTRQNYLDRTFAHEMTHAIMMSKVANFWQLPQFFTEGIADLTHGTDDTRGGYMRDIANDPDSFRTYLSMTPGTGNNYYYAAGFVFLRYLAKQASDLANFTADVLEVADTSNGTPTVTGLSVKNNVLNVGTTFAGKVIELSSYDSNVTKVDASKSRNAVNILGTSADNSIKGGSNDDEIFGGSGKDTLNGGAGNDVLSGGTGNDILNGEAGDDTLYGGAGTDTLIGGAGNDVFVHDIGNDLIQDYETSKDKIKLSRDSISSASVSGSNVVLKTPSGNITVVNGAGKQLTLIDKDDNIITTVVGGGDTMPAGLSIKSSVLTASAAFTGNKIDLNQSYASGATKVNASALSRGVSIVGTAAANSLKGGSGADTISGGAGNDTVSLGGGADVYVYSSGNDLIQDYTVGADKIKLASASITGASLSGSNVVLKTSSGNITVKGRKGKAITVIDASGKETSQVYPLSTLPAGISVSGATLTASNAFIGSEIDLADYATNVTKVNASAVTKNISIIGNAKANSLKGGKGTDTIFGGAGNDTLYGGAGSDTFVYASGKDVIADYAAGDKIKISSGTISKTAYSGQNVVFTVGNGSITVRNGKSKKITITDASGRTSTKTYTTGVSYGSNGNAAVSWFTEDDTNFISASANLDEISAEKFSVTNVESTNYENLAQENPIVLVSSNK